MFRFQRWTSMKLRWRRLYSKASRFLQKISKIAKQETSCLSWHVSLALIYQPHQNVRQHEIRDQYTDQFELAEKVYWLPTYLSREDPTLPILTPHELTHSITNRHSIYTANLDNDLWHTIMTARHHGKLVLAMGAGSIDAWLRQRLAFENESTEKS